MLPRSESYHIFYDHRFSASRTLPRSQSLETLLHNRTLADNFLTQSGRSLKAATRK